MGKTRTILELLKLMLRYTKTETVYYGLCGTVTELFCGNKITKLEEMKLDNYIFENPPSSFSGSNGCYYWEKSVKAPRIKWLKKHIKLEQ